MFDVRILGTSAATPFRHRWPSAQVVTLRDRHHLVDCGEGCQMQLQRFRVKLSRLDAIFISHLHLDHVMGLPGLLTSLSLNGRDQPLKLFGPANLEEMLQAIFKTSESRLVYELQFQATEDFEPGSVIYDHDHFQVRVIPLYHRIYCRGFLFVEKDKAPKLDGSKARRMNIPVEYRPLLKRGNTVTLPDGREIKPEEVLLPPEPPLSYAYCSDNRVSEQLGPFIKGVDLLYHESTFLDDRRDRAKETYHSTAAEAAELARDVGAGHLLLGHYSARYKDLKPLLDEARAIFPSTSLAREGQVFKPGEDFSSYADLPSS